MSLKRFFFLIIFFSFIILLSFEITLRLNKFTFNAPFSQKDLPLIYREINAGINIYQADPYLFWKYRANSEKKNWDISVNSLGFRDQEFSIKKKPGVFRIFCIGDSCTGGHALKLEYTFAKQLESLLNKNPNSKYEVINAGVPGYSSFQGLRYSKIIISKYAPDLIIAHFGYNDRNRAIYADKEFNWWVFFKSQLFRGIILRLKTCQYLMQRFYNPTKINWKIRVLPEEYKVNLEKMRDMADKNHASIIFIKPALKAEIVSGVPNVFYVPPVPYIDLFDLFKDYKDEPQIIFIDHEHPTAYANQLVASEIYKWIRRSGKWGRSLRGHP